MKTTLRAPAKVNIGLNIYQLKPWQRKHKLKSIFVRINDYADEIEIISHSHLVVEHFHDQQQVVYENDNLIKAIKLLQTKYHETFDYKIIIHHGIPWGAGLGGSSAAIGKVLNYLCQQHKISIRASLLKQIALKVGSDIPFFIQDEACCLVSGYGHIIKPLKHQLPAFELISNSIICETKQVFTSFDHLGRHPKNNFKQLTNALPNLKNCIIINNLEPAVFSLYPQLAKLKTSHTVLTGSGSYFIRFKE